MKKLIILFCAISLLGVACKTKEKNQVAPTGKVRTYRFIVSFASAGSGPDKAMTSKLEAFIEKHPQKPQFETSVWGKEGEIEYCFALNELADEAAKKEFISSVKKEMGKAKLVKYLENKPPTGVSEPNSK